MNVEPHPGASEFAEFTEALRGYRVRQERAVRRALRRVGRQPSAGASEELDQVARAVDTTLGTLDLAAEELRVQNEALFAARVDLEEASALFHDLFELAPAAYFVTASDTRIRYANEAACSLLRRPKNALAGKPLLCFVPLEERAHVRSAVLRATSATGMSQLPIALFATGVKQLLPCRASIRTVARDARGPRTLYWNILEETDEDLF